MSSSEFEFDDSDQDVAPNHDQLVLAAKNLDRVPKITKHKKSELVLTDSKFGTTKTKYGDDDKEEEVQKKSKKSKKKKAVEESLVVNPEQDILPKPLEKPAAERVRREVGYENTKTELKKWLGVVSRNRTAACVSFPLSQSSMRLEPTDKFVQRFRIQSELEKKLAELKPKDESDEEDEQFPMTLEEIIQKQKEVSKFRAQQSYVAAKARRQNKIKSKKFHRIQRKEKVKKAIEEFEKLKVTDPEAALKKLQEIDNARIEERMTLRHKNTGKWAQSQKIKAKYDKETRQVLAEQLAVSRDLTQKVKKDDDSDEDVGDGPPVPLPSSDKENPWMYPVKTDSEITDFISGYRKYWDDMNKANKSETSENNSTNEDKNKNKKLVEELEISGLPEDSNRTEQTESNDSDESENEQEKVTAPKQKKKLQKASKDKLGIKSSQSKITKVKKSKVKVLKAGTSSWSVENPEVTTSKTAVKEKPKKKKSSATPPVENDSDDAEDFDIDEMFDSAEDKIQEALGKALAKKKSQLEKIEQNEKKQKKGQKKNQKKRKRTKTDEVDDIEQLGLKGQKMIKPTIEKPIEESASSKPQENDEIPSSTATLNNSNKKATTSQLKKVEIDPNKFINMKPKFVKTMIPDGAGGEGLDAMDDENEQEEEEDQQRMISEAFADDDVVDEFRKEKEKEIKGSQPEDVNLTLPGWGSWGGKNIKISSRKKRRFILKVPKTEKRKDENKGDVVIMEEKNSKIKKHLVSELPFPYTSVQDYEASIRAPIGRDFVPEKVFSKLTTPAVKTKMGKIIEPMTEDVLVNVKNHGQAKKNKKKKKPAEVKAVNGKVKKNQGKKVQNGVKA